MTGLPSLIVLLLASSATGEFALNAQVADQPTCFPIPRPIKTVKAVQYYTDSQNSIVDPELAKINSQTTRHLRDYLLKLGEMTDELVKGPKSQSSNLDCITEWLLSWAEADALSSVDRNGSVLRTISAASLAITNLKFLTAVKSCGRKVATIEAWLHELVSDIVQHESKGRPPGHENNVTFWASLAAYTVGVAVDDERLRQWALGVYNRALDDVGPTGFWASETKRGAKALEYQLFALTPIVLLRIISEHHEKWDVGERDENLHRIVKASLQSIQDHAAIENEAGVALESSDLGRFETTITLMKAYACRFPNRISPAEVPQGWVRDWRIGTNLMSQSCPTGEIFPSVVTRCKRP